MSKNDEDFASMNVDVGGFKFSAFVKSSKPHRDAMRRDLSLEEVARLDAEEEEPHSETKNLGESEYRIFVYCQRKLTEATADGRQVLGLLHERIKKAMMAVGRPDYGSVETRAENKSREIEGSEGLELRNLHRDRVRLNTNLRFFKQKNGLMRDARYPDNTALMIGTLIAVVVAEAAANAVFFSRGSDLGLLGGALIALLVSVFNVGWSFLFGRLAYRGLNIRNAFLKLVCMVGVVAHIFGALLINLAVAHYRQLMSTVADSGGDPDTALDLVVSQMVQDPFAIGSFDSIMLLVIGAAVTVFATYEGYHSDDVYPGFGEMTRELRAAEGRCEKQREKMLVALNVATDECISQIDAMLRDAEAAKNAASVEVQRFSIWRETIDVAVLEHQRVLEAFFKEYRYANTLARATPTPVTFDQAAPKLQNEFDHPELITTAQEGHLEKVIADARSAADAAKGRIISRADERQAKIDRLFEQLRERGEEDFRRDTDLPVEEMERRRRTAAERYHTSSESGDFEFRADGKESAGHEDQRAGRFEKPDHEAGRAYEESRTYNDGSAGEEQAYDDQDLDSASSGNPVVDRVMSEQPRRSKPISRMPHDDIEEA